MKKSLGAYILCGGKSSRMGADKGLQLLHNKPLVIYSIELCRQFTPHISLVTNSLDYEKFGYECINDNYDDQGPAGGIEAALKHSAHEKNIILGCDMPFVDVQMVQFLFDKSKSFDITVPCSKLQNTIEPLVGIYHKNCAEQWSELMANDTRKLTVLMENFATNLVDVDKFLTYNPRLFMNINTPQLLAEANNWTL